MTISYFERKITVGQERAITYEEIKAYQTSQGINLYEMDSSGVVTGGFMVNWETSGFTGSGWDTGTPNSPLQGKTEAEIQQEINDKGNLTRFFTEWADNVGLGERLIWVGNWEMKYPDCVVAV